MRFMQLPCDTKLSGFLRPASQLQFGPLPLADHVQHNARRAGLQTLPTSTTLQGPLLVARDDVFISARAFRQLKKSLSTQKSVCRIGMPTSELLRLTRPVQQLVDTDEGSLFDVFFIPEGTATTPDALFERDDVDAHYVPYKEALIDVGRPRHILGVDDDVMPFPFSTTLMLQVRHWVCALRLSHVLPQILLMEQALAHPLSSTWKALWSLRFSKASTFAAAKRQFVFKGKNVVIHPSAVVEASVIGDNVTIGPHASVIGSVLGDDVTVEDRAHVNQTVVGPKTFISRNSSMTASLVMGHTDPCANGIQACVVDEEVGLTSFARPLDLSLQGQVKVDDDGVLVDTGELPCGVFFSRGCFVGGGVTIAAGRVVPPGLRVVAGGDAVFRRFPTAEERQASGADTYTLESGKLTPVLLRGG